MKRIILILFVFGGIFFLFKERFLNQNQINVDSIYCFDVVGKNVDDAVKFANDMGIKLDFSYKYNLENAKGIIIFQEKVYNVKFGDSIKVVVSLGSVPIDTYIENKVNEMGKVPIMMYHGIVDISDDDTEYVGGNVDKDGYNRTTESFRNDLEFYYANNYRMIRLEDYVDGFIDVELGKSPIILTFDDGNENSFKVLGEKDGELVIDPNCAVGILEEFKLKYPDYGVTATFFINNEKFNQNKYNDKILKWLVKNGYDIGNHTMNHVDFKQVDKETTQKEVGGLYQVLDEIIPLEYVNIIALPFGSPYSKDHSNYGAILKGIYNGKDYVTKAALRVGWEAELSPFHQNFDPTYLKRIRAYDNEGYDFDIEMNFKLLESNRYISDGNINTIVFSGKDDYIVNENYENFRVIVY